MSGKRLLSIFVFFAVCFIILDLWPEPNPPFPTLRQAKLLQTKKHTRWYQIPIADETSLVGELDDRGVKYIGSADYADEGSDFFGSDQWIVEVRAGSKSKTARVLVT
jgi:hypothetical protein